MFSTMMHTPKLPLAPRNLNVAEQTPAKLPESPSSIREVCARLMDCARNTHDREYLLERDLRPKVHLWLALPGKVELEGRLNGEQPLQESRGRGLGLPGTQ